MKKLIVFLSLFISSFVYADSVQKYDFWVEQLPGVCGNQTEIDRYIENNNYIPLNYSVGRAGSTPDGKPVFFITYYVNEDVTQSMAVVQVPNSGTACIMYITFDVLHNEEELKKGKATKLPL